MVKMLYFYFTKVTMMYLMVASTLFFSLVSSTDFAGLDREMGLIITGIPMHTDSLFSDHKNVHRWKRRVEPRGQGGDILQEPGDIHVVKEEEAEEGEGEKEKRRYRRLEHDIRIRGEIRSRYAMTLVENTVQNSESEAREVFFSVILPDTAFISKFAMEVGGEIYLAEVREKEEAWRLYKEAVEDGKSAGHVGINARHSNRFRVSVNTEAGAKVRFYLLYEELLQRRGGIYRYIINLSPHQKLGAYSIDVNLVELSNITRLTVPHLKKHHPSGEDDLENEEVGEGSAQLEGVEILASHTQANTARIQYRPQVNKLQDLTKEAPIQFVVEYDVDRSKGGELQLYEGYFVHFVAPAELPPMPKHVVFVLDTSGSMKHRKMQQTVNAMKTILGEMRDQDYITIVRFSSDVSVWEVNDNSIVEASPNKRQLAIEYVETLEAKGETDINSALVKALTIVAHVQQKGILEGVQSMLFFLTDGHPTVGVTDFKQILQNVQDANKLTQAAIFSLAFGVKTDFSMLKTLSIQNYGFARKIYTAADASLQLEGLYKEVSSPILSNVTFNYMDSKVVTNSVTETVFHTFYQGGEMVVAGRVNRDTDSVLHSVTVEEVTAGEEEEEEDFSFIGYEITAHQAVGEYRLAGSHKAKEITPMSETVDAYIEFLPSVSIEYNFLERLWAYLSVQNLLVKLTRGQLYSCSPPPVQILSEEDSEGMSPGPLMCNNLERALYLALKYQFVTPLTSLVVVKPEERENGDFGEADMFSKITLSSATHFQYNTTPLLLSLLLLVLNNSS